MYDALKDTIFLTIPFVACLTLAALLTYMYWRERNPRKIVFAIAVFLSAFGFYNPLAESLGVAPIFLSQGWLFVPMALAVMIAALSSLLRMKDFKKPFMLFSAGTAAALVAFFTQFSFGSLRLAIVVFFISVAVPTLVYLYYRSKNATDLTFLLASVCFLFQGIVSDLGSSPDIPVLLALFGVIFIALMFTGPQGGDVSHMASFVVLEKKLDEANQNLRLMQEKLLRAERLAAIGELAGMIGHDLRNPLQGIAGAAYYLKAKSTAAKDVTSQEMIQNIETCIARSNKIINDLIEYSQVLVLEPSETNPQMLTEHSLSQITVPDKIEVLNLTLSEPLFTVDCERIERALVGIIKNAFDAMPEGGKLVITSQNISEHVVIRFEDAGIGMSQETLSKLWTPLFTTKAKGMGFGLANCKRIVEAHGGDIRVESELGKGSVFTVMLPLEFKLPN